MVYDFEGSDYGVHSIDSLINSLSINQSVFNNQSPPRMSHDEWHRLTDDAKKTWGMLTDEALFSS